jgi:hypothetical protein
MTAAIAVKQDLKLWRINFIGTYLNSLTKEDIYMRQLEGFIEPGFEDYVCKLIHTIYSTMQGVHDWYETLSWTSDKLGYVTSQVDPCVRFKQENGGYMIMDTYIPTRTMFLVHPRQTRRLRRESKKWGRCGRSRISGKPSTSLELGSNKISTWVPSE